MIAVQNRHRLLVHQGPHDAGLHIYDDPLAEPVGLARVMRDHRGDRGLGAGVQSRLRKRHLNRRLTFLPHQVHHSARRPADNIRPLVVFAGTLVAEGRYRSVDESRIQFRERVVAEPDRIEVTELKRLDQEVAFGREVGDQRASIGGIEIGGDGFFSGLVCDEIEAPIEPDLIFEERRDAACRASAGRLDLDHLGAQVGENLAAHRALLVGEIEHPKTLEQF